MWFGRGSDMVRTRLGRGSDVARTWFGRGSDVVSDLAQTVWQKLRESGFQHACRNASVLETLACRSGCFGRREKTPTPKTRFSIWTLLRTPGRFTTRPLPVYFTTKMSVVRPFSVPSKDEIGPK